MFYMSYMNPAAEYNPGGLQDPIDPFKPSLAFSFNNVFPNRARHGYDREPRRSSLHDPPQNTSYGPQYQSRTANTDKPIMPCRNNSDPQYGSYSNRYNYGAPYDTYADTDTAPTQPRITPYTKRHGVVRVPFLQDIAVVLQADLDIVIGLLLGHQIITFMNEVHHPPHAFLHRSLVGIGRSTSTSWCLCIPESKSSVSVVSGRRSYSLDNPPRRFYTPSLFPSRRRRTRASSFSPRRRSYTYPRHHRRYASSVSPHRRRKPSSSPSPQRPQPPIVIQVPAYVGSVLAPQPPLTNPLASNLPTRPCLRSGLVDSYELWHYIFAFLRDTVPRQICRHLLLRLPDLYRSRVERIFDDAELSMPIIKQAILDTARTKQQAAGYGSGQPHLSRSIWEQPQTVASTRLQGTWDLFSNSLQREWETLNIFCIVITGYLDNSTNIKHCRRSCYSIFCTFSHDLRLLYGCIFIIRFGTMRKTYKVAEWCEQTKSLRVGLFWNVWVFAATPATWLAWSIILFIVTVMSFIWRTTPVSPPNAADESFVQVLVPRIIVSLVVGLGAVYFALIPSTLGTYGEMMDRAWRRRIWGWMNDGIGPGYGAGQAAYVPYTVGGQGYGMANMAPQTVCPPPGQGCAYNGAYGGYGHYPPGGFRRSRRRRSGGVRFNSRGRANTSDRHGRRSPSVRTVDSEKGSSTAYAGVPSTTSVDPTLLHSSDYTDDLPEKGPSSETGIQEAGDGRRRSASSTARTSKKKKGRKGRG